ncbi:MAG: hypothetical protein AAGD05_18135, partial [Bacteroidota bacterium]
THLSASDVEPIAEKSELRAIQGEALPMLIDDHHVAFDPTLLTAENPSIIYRALWFLMESLLAGVIYDGVKARMSTWATEASKSYPYSSGVRKHVDHIVEEWQAPKTQYAAKEHVRVCSICRNAANDVY